MSLDFHQLLHKRILNYRFVKYFPWNNFCWFLLGLTVTVGDAKLVIATGIFPLVMFFSYRLNTLSCFNSFLLWIQNLHPNHYRLLKSVILAGISSLIFYLVLDFSPYFNNLGAMPKAGSAIALMVHLLIIVIALLLLEDKFLFSSQNKIKTNLNDLNNLTINLSEKSSIRRLWAVNQVWHRLKINYFDYIQLTEIREYLRLLIKIEEEIIIKQKIEIILEEIDSIFARSIGEDYPLQSSISPSKSLASSSLLSKVMSEKTEIKAPEMIPFN